MNIINIIRKKLPFLEFRNLNIYLVAIFLVGLLMNVVNPLYYYFNLSLDVGRILSGEIWRLATFVFYPPSSGRSVILSLVMIYVYYSITKTLTMMWGNFKFNFYMLIGYIGQILGAFITYYVIGKDIILYPIYTTFSIFMAFALSFPDTYFLIYFFIPVKAKYFAYLEILIYVINFLYSDVATRIAIICSGINVFIFFVLLKDELGNNRRYY